MSLHRSRAWSANGCDPVVAENVQDFRFDCVGNARVVYGPVQGDVISPESCIQRQVCWGKCGWGLRLLPPAIISKYQWTAMSLYTIRCEH